MFLGVNTLNLDAKGRMAIPAKYRGELADCCASRIVVTIHPHERCLWLYPENEWREVARQLSRLPTLKRQNQMLKRLLLGYASEMDMDAQGRILLSPELRDHAGLEKRVSVVGQGNKFEIWNESAWTGLREDWLAEVNDPESGMSDELAEMAF